MSLQYEFTCTIHNFRYGFDRPANEPANFGCPMCARKTTNELLEQVATLTEHRDLLLQAIDLKRTAVSASAPRSES